MNRKKLMASALAISLAFSAVSFTGCEKKMGGDGENKYVIGEDIDPGEYCFVPDGNVTWISVYAGANQGEMLCFFEFDTQVYLTLYNGQMIKVCGTSFKEADNTPGESTGTGVFRAGIDISPGKHTIEAGDGLSRYVISSDNSANTFGDILNGEIMTESSVEVELEAGDYILVEDAKLVK